MPPLRKAEKGNSCGCFSKQDASSCNPYTKLTCSNEQHPVARSMHCVAGYPTMYRYFDIPHPPPQKISCCCRCKYCCRQLPTQKFCLSEQKSTQTDGKATSEETTQCPEEPVQVVEEEKVTVVTTTKSVTRIMSVNGLTMDKDVPEERQSAEEKTTKQIKSYSKSEALDDLNLIDTQKEEMEGATVRTSTNSNKDENQGKPLTQTDLKDTSEQTPTPLKDAKVHMEKTISVTRFYSDGNVSTEMDNLSNGSAMSRNVPEEKPIKTQKRKPELATADLDSVNTQKGERREVTSDSKKDKDTNEQTEIPAPIPINAKHLDKNKKDLKTTRSMTKFYPEDNVSTEMDMTSKSESEDLDSGRKTSGMSDATPGEFQIPQMVQKPIDLQPDDNAVTQIDTPNKYTEDLNKSNTAIKDSSGSRLNQPDVSEQKQAETTDTYLLDNTSNVISDRERGYEDYAKDTESSGSFKQNDSTETRDTNDEDPLNESADVSNEESGNKIIEKATLEESDEEEDHREVQRENCSCCRMLPRILPYNPCPFYCKQCLCRHRSIYGCMPWQAYPVGSESNTTRWLPNCPPPRRQ